MSEIELDAADASVQREVEAWAISQLAAIHGPALRPRTVHLLDGARIELDAANGDGTSLTVACEIYARVGQLKGSQPKKLATDVLKLALIQNERIQAEFGPARLKMVVVDSFAQECLESKRSWLGSAVRHFGIEVELLELPKDLRAKVVATQRRQGSRAANGRRRTTRSVGPKIVAAA